MSNTTAELPNVCPYCGSAPHQYITLCPRVKSVEYDAIGRITRVEKFSPRPWPSDDYTPLSKP